MQRIKAEPQRLLNNRKYNHAVISACILLESELRQKFYSDESLQNLVSLAEQIGLIDNFLYTSILSWIDIRNKAVHTTQVVTATEAEMVVRGISSALEIIRSNYNTRSKVLTKRDRTILGTRYFKSLCEKLKDEDESIDSKEVYDSTGVQAFSKDVVLPLIIYKLKSLGYIEAIRDDRIRMTSVGIKHCGEEITLDDII